MIKQVVVAGNGPSLKTIDYSLLPKEYDVFRCNHFYLEEKYFLGRKIKASFFIIREFFEQYYMMQKLLQNGDYECENIVCKMYNFQDRKEKIFRENFNFYFPTAINGYDEYFSKLTKLSKDIDFNVCYNFKREEMLTGTYAICCAVACGYKQIYVAGMDFYENGGSHFYNDKSYNLNSSTIHNKNEDIRVINFLKDNYDVEILSICPDSTISKYIPLAKQQNQKKMTVENKPETAIMQKLLPSKKAIRRYKKLYLMSNNFISFIYDILRSPRAIKRYFLDKYSR